MYFCTHEGTFTSFCSHVTFLCFWLQRGHFLLPHLCSQESTLTCFVSAKGDFNTLFQSQIAMFWPQKKHFRTCFGAQEGTFACFCSHITWHFCVFVFQDGTFHCLCSQKSISACFVSAKGDFYEFLRHFSHVFGSPKKKHFCTRFGPQNGTNIFFHPREHFSQFLLPRDISVFWALFVLMLLKEPFCKFCFNKRELLHVFHPVFTCFGSQKNTFTHVFAPIWHFCVFGFQKDTFLFMLLGAHFLHVTFFFQQKGIFTCF